jgi:hypothetical protein
MRIALGLFFIGGACANIGILIRYTTTGQINQENIVVNTVLAILFLGLMGLFEIEKHGRG